MEIDTPRHDDARDFIIDECYREFLCDMFSESFHVGSGLDFLFMGHGSREI